MLRPPLLRALAGSVLLDARGCQRAPAPRWAPVRPAALGGPAGQRWARSTQAPPGEERHRAAESRERRGGEARRVTSPRAAPRSCWQRVLVSRCTPACSPPALFPAVLLHVLPAQPAAPAPRAGGKPALLAGTSALPGRWRGWVPVEGLACELEIVSLPSAEQCLNPSEEQRSQHLFPVCLYFFHF